MRECEVVLSFESPTPLVPTDGCRETPKPKNYGGLGSALRALPMDVEKNERPRTWTKSIQKASTHLVFLLFVAHFFSCISARFLASGIQKHHKKSHVGKKLQRKVEKSHVVFLGG
jgi:hypothetical protein